MKILLVHAYSPRNTGDGLLVDLARDVVHQAVPDAQIVCVALDAGAFGTSDVVQWSPAAQVTDPRRAVLLAGVLGPHRALRAAFADADLIVAVGGGYLRASTVGEGVKSFLAHVSQLRLVARSTAPSVYLPQSIGPYPAPVRRLVQRLLARIDLVCVRDDRSRAELAAAGTLERFPDLAVLEAGTMDRALQARTIDDVPVVVARELPGPRNYHRLLDGLGRALGPVWAVQSTASNNNDVPLTARLAGTDDPPLLRDVLAGGTRRVVISTRLHGSMAALLAGSPTIHLSYERKGWGAFEDLGIARHVHNARNVDVDTVLAGVREITEDPATYWASVNERLPAVAARHRELVERVGGLAAARAGVAR
ncbi:polysaccharide pyruvyl transferase family protein [Litorihabitans aurantiacus]|uniref:Polysaccharide pyruvyl transferase n=1 Tax=Litorihabitans aurantiacus TaxID=1930061 RepID=A0AA37UTZ4_9MICO|nr:polysaccharide pyruvyl transferase family protein [Litorihabitans aurantiacus]GMA30387.1 polysaccharide pyruvyl transferase [Litorihabitans aurantiacus]